MEGVIPLFFLGTREWRNRQTRTVQVRVPVMEWGFNSPLAHDETADPTGSAVFVFPSCGGGVVAPVFSFCLWSHGCSGRRRVRAALCARGRRPAREPSALRASLGASPRSPARPHHRPLAPRQIPPAPFTPAALCRWSVLVCRLEARPGPVPRSVPYPQFRMQFPDTCSSSLSEKPGISTITFQSMKCAWGNCMRICADQAPPPLTGTAAWSLYSLWASWGSRVLSFWGGLVRVVTNVVNPRSFSCGFLPRCYERRQSEGFFAENGCFWA